MLAKEKNNLAVLDFFNKKEIIRVRITNSRSKTFNIYHKALLTIKNRYFRKTNSSDFNNGKKKL